jgi:hypothetical protein
MFGYCFLNSSMFASNPILAESQIHTTNLTRSPEPADFPDSAGPASEAPPAPELPQALANKASVSSRSKAVKRFLRFHVLICVVPLMDDASLS